jgi:hypothetical protein
MPTVVPSPPLDVLSRHTSWDDFVAKAKFFGPDWVFRGALATSRLETTLERACRAWQIDLSRAQTVEDRLIEDFRRHPQVGAQSPDSGDTLGWIALMQHHGAPTRLLDWTYSPFVAAYFAFTQLLNRLMEPDVTTPRPEAAIWALDTGWLRKRLKARGVLGGKKLKALEDYDRARDAASFRRVFQQNPERFVYTANPLRLHERLSIQQGVFLCPGDVSCSWMENLEALEPDASAIQRFAFDHSQLNHALTGLRHMNITARSLFPGLDGYARSMTTRLKLLCDLAAEREEPADDR